LISELTELFLTPTNPQYWAVVKIEDYYLKESNDQSQNEIYSQVSYGEKNIWEISARIGVSDLKIFDAFSSTEASTSTNKNDFVDNRNFFGTLGAKGFYPINETFGIGAFVQGTYYFNQFSDGVAGNSGSKPFSTDLKVDNLWDVNFGVGFQAAIPYGIKNISSLNPLFRSMFPSTLFLGR
jgi:hypothetical protein